MQTESVGASGADQQLEKFSDDFSVRTLSDYQVLSGYDALKYIGASPALTPVSPSKGGRPNQVINTMIASSALELAQSSALNIDMRAGYLGVSGGVASEIVNSVTESETSVVIVASLDYVRANVNVTNDQALDLTEAARALAADPDTFHKQFGGYFCNTVVLGGQLFVIYQLTMSSRTDASKVRVALDGKFENVGTMASFMASVKAEMEKTRIAYRSSLKIHKIGAGGPLPDFDPNKPDEAAKAINAYINRFIADVEADPKPYYGEYRGYWRRFKELEPLREKVIAASRVVDALVASACDYADVTGIVAALLDPGSAEGYHLDETTRAELLALRGAVTEAAGLLHRAYAEMLGFDSYLPPERIPELAGRLPAVYRDKAEAIRTRLKTQILYGQTVTLHFPISSRVVSDASVSVPAGEAPAPEGGDKDWPYLTVRVSGAQSFRLRPMDEARNGEVVRNSDVIRLEQTVKAYQGQQIYMSDAGRAVRTASYEGGQEAIKYQWRVRIDGGKDGVVLTSDKAVKLVNLNWNEEWFLHPGSNGYLYVTNDGKEDWKLHIHPA